MPDMAWAEEALNKLEAEAGINYVVGIGTGFAVLLDKHLLDKHDVHSGTIFYWMQRRAQAALDQGMTAEVKWGIATEGPYLMMKGPKPTSFPDPYEVLRQRAAAGEFGPEAAEPPLAGLRYNSTPWKIKAGGQDIEFDYTLYDHKGDKFVLKRER